MSKNSLKESALILLTLTRVRALLLCASLVWMVVAISPAWALELDTAKAQGLVGETTSGYLAPVKAPSAEVKSMVDRINAERKSRYAAIAKQNNTPVAAVEALAGQKAQDMTPAGQFIQTAQGQWTQK